MIFRRKVFENYMKSAYNLHEKSSDEIDHNYDLHEENMRSTKRDQEI